MTDTAILVISFGTSWLPALKSDIVPVEDAIRAASPGLPLQRAFTSGFIRSKLKNEKDLFIPGVDEALDQLSAKGIRHLLVQPTHMIRGHEYEKAMAALRKKRSLFASIRVGLPLLSAPEDHAFIQAAVRKEILSPKEDELLLLMGHGTSHPENAVYLTLADELETQSHSHILLATVDGKPDFDCIRRKIHTAAPKKIMLAPLMTVAGEHALNDMSGEAPDSWKSILKKDGFSVSCHLHGLGSLPSVQKQFLAHLSDAQLL